MRGLTLAALVWALGCGDTFHVTNHLGGGDGGQAMAGGGSVRRDAGSQDGDASADASAADAALSDAQAPLEAGPKCDDYDGDGICDLADPCPLDAMNDRDSDGACDSMDPCPDDTLNDRDGDGVCDSDDACPDDSQDDRDGDGVCDGADPCPDDSPDDTDGDGACDSDDACPLDANDDSDGDGSCDSADKCPGHSDVQDSDADGVPNGCDTCPGKSDADGNANGYADACDQVLSTRTIVRNYSKPVTYLKGIFEVRDELALDTLYADLHIQVPLASSFDVTTEDVVAIMDELQKPRLNNAKVRLFSVANWNSGTETYHNDANPITTENVLVRARVWGSFTAPSSFTMTLELRGY